MREHFYSFLLAVSISVFPALQAHSQESDCLAATVEKASIPKELLQVPTDDTDESDWKPGVYEGAWNNEDCSVLVIYNVAENGKHAKVLYAYAGNVSAGVMPDYEIVEKAKIKKGVQTVKPASWFRYSPKFEVYYYGSLQGKYKHNRGTATITMTPVDSERLSNL